MPDYAFTEREQSVIRQLGKLGFRYDRETKKTIEFVNDSGCRAIELNREHAGLALVFGFGDEKHLSGIDGIQSVGRRSGSNFKKLPKGITRTGRSNHQGVQVVIDTVEHVPAVV